MKYDFDELIDRRGTDSLKWDLPEQHDDMLPMWVADMDFRVCPAITDALRRVVDRGIFGYVNVPASYYESLSRWFFERHRWAIHRSQVIYTSGVVPAISAVIKALVPRGKKVLVQTPVYNCFFSSIRNNGCLIEESPLIHTAEGWRMDLDDLERRAADPDVALMLLCNPHNPVGRVWTLKELTEVHRICRDNGVRVLSDEIHCELIMGNPASYTPYALVDPTATVCVSPSKAFNIAGLQIANIIVGDPTLYDPIDRAINENEVCDVNPFGVAALQAAYDHGGEWLDQLIDYLRDNYEYMREFCERNFPRLPLSTLEATYLVWMDIHALGMTSLSLATRLDHEEHLRLNPGKMYGDAGQSYIRWNIATPRARLVDALNRFKRFVDAL